MRCARTMGLIGAASLVAAGCGGASSKSANQTVNVTRAAYVSGGASGYKAAYSLQETLPGQGQVGITASGDFSALAHTGSFHAQLSLPSSGVASFGVSNLQMQMVLVPGTLYMKLPPQLASKIPGGKPWWKIDLSQAGKLAGIPGFSSLLNSSSSFNDPGQYLDFLRATSGGSVKNLGPETVNGVQTTHYHARVDLSKLPNAVPAADRAAAQQLVGALRHHGLMTQGLPIDAWIDSSHLIRRIELAYNQPVSGGQMVDVSMKADFLDYGPQPRPSVPPAGQTLDLVSLLQHG